MYWNLRLLNHHTATVYRQRMIPVSERFFAAVIAYLDAERFGFATM